LRGETFVTRKITRAAAKISLGLQEKLFMGNIDSERDWGHAKDYVEGMWRMLQQDVAEDYVLATGIKITVREFINMAFAEVGITLKWEGKAENEKGIDVATENVLVEIDPKYYRPAEVELLVGDATKAKTNMGWTPTYTVAELCKEMVASDVEIFKRDKYLLDGGHKILNYKE
jgi:GDPmannose 4,6-dehydratase